MYRVYIGNLDSEVTEAILNDVLRQRSVSSTTVVVKRGYAFVDCSDAVAFDHAIQQLNGRPMYQFSQNRYNNINGISSAPPTIDRGCITSSLRCPFPALSR